MSSIILTDFFAGNLQGDSKLYLSMLKMKSQEFGGVEEGRSSGGGVGNALSDIKICYKVNIIKTAYCGCRDRNRPEEQNGDFR